MSNQTLTNSFKKMIKYYNMKIGFLLVKLTTKLCFFSFKSEIAKASNYLWFNIPSIIKTLWNTISVNIYLST